MNPKLAIPGSPCLDRIAETPAFSADEPLVAVVDAAIQEQAARQGLPDTSVKAQLSTYKRGTRNSSTCRTVFDIGR